MLSKNALDYMNICMHCYAFIFMLFHAFIEGGFLVHFPYFSPEQWDADHSD